MLINSNFINIHESSGATENDNIEKILSQMLN